MSKKRIPVLPNGSKSYYTSILYGTIIEMHVGHVIAKFLDAPLFLPKYRFIKKDDKANLSIGAKVKWTRYFSDSTKKELVASNLELASE